MTNDIYESLSTLGGKEPESSMFFETEKGKAVHRDYQDITGYAVKAFTLNFIKILDLSIIKNNKYFMSREQQEFFEKYCTEADTVLSSEMKQFDTFLGEYRGEDDG